MPGPVFPLLLGIAAVGTRAFLGLIFFTGGMSKLMPFPGVMGPVWLEDVLEPHGLGLFARFIGWSEAVIGLLLMSQRFAALGAVMLVPLVVNILMVTVSMQWRGTPYVVGFFLALNVFLLAYDVDRWKSLVVRSGPVRRPYRGTLRHDAACLAGMAVCLGGPFVHGTNPSVAYGMVLVGLGLMAGAWLSGLRQGARRTACNRAGAGCED